MSMELNIRNMVCRHCIAAVTRTLTDMGLAPRQVSLGHAVIEPDELLPQQLSELKSRLAEGGFTLAAHPDEEMVEQAKLAVMELVRSDADASRARLSALVEERAGVPYDTVSRTFSRLEGRTIDRYYILQRVERVKELLDAGALTVSEIAYRTGFSSVAHLSRQFKSVTGMTPTDYLALPMPRRAGIDRI